MSPEKSSPAELVELLGSDASFEFKARACQRLAVVGNEQAIPSLAKLLGDDRLSDFARSALENIALPAAGAVLIEALPKLNGRLLAGVVNSLAVRQEKAALGGLIELAKDPVRGMRSGVLAAIGRIAATDASMEDQTQRALAMLSSVSDSRSEAALLEIAHANLATSAMLIRVGNTDVAIRMLKSLLSSNAPAHIREAAQELLRNSQAISLFDGHSLDGWKGDLSWFRVFDRAIIAGSMTKEIPQNEFLVDDRVFEDFELRLQFRLVNPKGNGGIQFRSKRVEGSSEMEGYQADIAEGFWGGIYDESRRKTFLGTRCDPSALVAVLKPDGWNCYTIRCEGPHIRLWINGLLTTDFMENDPAIPRSGHIGLQIHSGPPSEVWYREIQIEDLSPR